MQSFSALYAVALAIATLAITASALDSITAPANITANEEFNITFDNANSDSYRVYLAASLLPGNNGPTCYLLNSTTLANNNTLTLQIPPGVGPPASYYSIAISDLSTTSPPTYSNTFTLASANGTYTSYENDLQGSPFWSANNLPCTAYTCARTCAMDSYPDDLTKASAYNVMKECILGCDGVTQAASQTAPALSVQATGTGTSTEEADAAVSSGAAVERKGGMVGVAAVGLGAIAFLL